MRKIVLDEENVNTLLAANVKNRKVSKNRVVALAREMAAGRYLWDNGQTIVINRSWSWLLDGQHRLLAVAKSGCYGAEVYLAEVPDEDACRMFNTIDTCRGNRSVSTVLALNQTFPNAKNVASMLMAWLHHSIGMQSPSAELLTALYEKTVDVVDAIYLSRRISIGNFHPRAVASAGAFNAMLLARARRFAVSEEDVKAGWMAVKNGSIGRFTATKSLLDYLVQGRGKRVNKDSNEFFVVTKALVQPTRKIIKIQENEDVTKFRFGKLAEINDLITGKTNNNQNKE